MILALDVLDGQDSRGLLVYNRAKASLALDNDVGNAHLSAEGREVDNQLNRIYIVSDNDQSGLLGFDEGNCMVEAVLDE